MALNPISYSDSVIRDFLRYQATAYAFSDEGLRAQLRALLSLDKTRETPLFKGPYISLSRAFSEGASVGEFVSEGLLHPHLQNIAFPQLYGHQERAIKAILDGKPTLISTGTGSGKTECFLYPVISHCLTLRDEHAPPGIVAVFVYPMNSLAEDQLGRLRGLLAGTGVPFGMYVGKTPERTADVAGERLSGGSSLADYQAALAQARAERRGTGVHPPEERISREQMRSPGEQPRILLTNVKQLELLLTRQSDVHLFDGADLKYIVFDEAHTYGGANGAETACLVRRLRAYCGRSADETVCVGTSATLVDPDKDTSPATEFAGRFFGVATDEVELVTEEYQEDDWAAERSLPPAPEVPAPQLLESTLDALAEGTGEAVAAAYERLSGETLDTKRWEQDLYDRLAANELCYQLARHLREPLALDELCESLVAAVNRQVTDAEVLTWLALGVASRRDGRPLLRPVVHGFVTGVGNAVVTFPEDHNGPKLWLSGGDEGVKDDEQFRLEVTTCNTCGQHYFIHYLADLRFGPAGMEGGDAVGDGQVWRSLDRTKGGVRIVLLNHLVTGGDDNDDDDALPSKAVEVWMCRVCGALHPADSTRCDACGRPGPLVYLLAVEHSEKYGGYLTSCLSCKSPGGRWGDRYREPARPVRAVPVSDVHVLAQNMVHHADRKRLLVFTDNRQEAAFQAGWMRDHARRFRIRSLMYERIRKGPVSIGDLATHMDRVLDEDDMLSRAIIPEVWAVARKEQSGVEHARERKAFLRILILREIVTGVKQRIGLEPWGRIKVEYQGLQPDLEFIRTWAERLDVTPERLTEGIGAILDVHRRGSILYDPEGKIFSHFWMDGDREVQYGYLPKLPGIPKALKLSRAPVDDKNRVGQWLSERGQTAVRQAAAKFGVEKDDVPAFLEALWQFLTDELEIFTPVTLTGARGRALRGCAGARQIDADKITIRSHEGRWRCSTCRRAQVRPTPRDKCITWRCSGSLVFEPEDPDDYDLLALREDFTMLRAAEHSAQVPHQERERLEELFKGEAESVNTLVCTPTLELGVDIGGLDTVLLRNVPPLPSNYWQRVGRAGRRHRIAVNITYARPNGHDRAYFADPMKLLNGRIEPPQFNLKNTVMLDKHVRAAVITRLRQLARENSSLTEFDRNEIHETLELVLPRQIRDYLFDENGRVRTEPLDVSTLQTVITKHADDLVDSVLATFRDNWPEADAAAVEEKRLRETVLSTCSRLEQVVRTLKRRLDWALGQLRRMDEERRVRGTLDPDEDQLHRRCDRLVKRLKGIETRTWRQAEGYDETNTYGVLAAEGFLPGYGLEIGAVVGTALMPRHLDAGMDFNLPRPPAVALREYVPGNLIYANNHRFVARFFHLAVGDARAEPVQLFVDVERSAVREVGTDQDDGVAQLGGAALSVIPVCDVDLQHVSRITDNEDYRFQLPVASAGYEQGRHGAGVNYGWGGRSLSFRHGVHLRLVNLGPVRLVADGKLGYPLSLVTGQSRSPFASERELEDFATRTEERTGKKVQKVGFYADIVADAITLPDCESTEEAYSVIEALRAGMRQVLEMERQDVLALVIPRPGDDRVDALLYDPMPGGSGLLEQALQRWDEVVATAEELLDACASACERSCIDCLQTFRNAYYHKHLDRHAALDRLRTWGCEIDFEHEIVPRIGAIEPRGAAQPVNVAEAKLKGLLDRAGFPSGEWQHEIALGRPLGKTYPDVFFAGEDDQDPGVCIYLDGLSAHLHGNPETAARDRQIREELRTRHYEVFEIAASHLDDRGQMVSHFRRLARVLLGRDRAQEIRENTAWFYDTAQVTYGADEIAVRRVAEPSPVPNRDARDRPPHE